MALVASLVAHGLLLGAWGGDPLRVRRGAMADTSNPPHAQHRPMVRMQRGEAAIPVLASRLIVEDHVEPKQDPAISPVAPKPAVQAATGILSRNEGASRLPKTAAPDVPAPATVAPPGDIPAEPTGDLPHGAAPPSAAPPGHQRQALLTHIPADFNQALIVSRGSQTGQGQWVWSVTGGRYRSELKAQVLHGNAPRNTPGLHADAASGAAPTALHWSSIGGVDEHGVAPERFLTQPTKGGARAVNFQRDTGRVSYSGPTGQAALVPGAQDRLSWLAQLLALAQAHLEGRGLPAELPIWVAGPQGDGGDWWFTVKWNPLTSCWQFTRRAERRYDVQVQAWVAVGSQARLIRLEMGSEGSRQAPWLLRDAARPEACGHPPGIDPTH